MSLFSAHYIAEMACCRGLLELIYNPRRSFTMEKKKVVSYCRVACNNQNNDVLDDQEQTLKKYAEAQNYEIVETIKESGGGLDLNRPGINKIYEIADNGKVDAVIAKNISRYGRCSPAKIADFVESLKEKNVEVLTMMDGDLKNIIPLLKSFS